jgi:ribosomal protein S15P/S13E
MKHLDSGTIHAFLDGELSGDQLEFATAHFSLCDACSNLMLEAESETDAVMQAFAVENSYAVPTQRIWARINNEIDHIAVAPEVVSQTASAWQNVAAWLGFDKLSPFAAPSAGFALGVALVAVFTFYNFRHVNPEISPVDVAVSQTPPVATVNVQTPESSLSVGEQPSVPANVIKNEAPKRIAGFEAVKASFRVEEKPSKKNTVITNKTPKTAVDLKAPLVEERLYLDAINDLSQTVASSDEEVMRPSFRVEYEQNIALMDRAINKMQKQVRRNPNDENAKRILFASYQNKIDLLNTVAEKSQLMATLR